MPVIGLSSVATQRKPRDTAILHRRVLARKPDKKLRLVNVVRGGLHRGSKIFQIVLLLLIEHPRPDIDQKSLSRTIERSLANFQGMRHIRWAAGWLSVGDRP